MKTLARATTSALSHDVIAFRTTAALTCCAALLTFGADTPRHVSGIYPHLATFNNEGECGTGAVVPWAGRLWVISYGPHLPLGSSDKLYEVTPDLRQSIRPESVGGTPANRMIHHESKQLIIGPYFIDESRNVRVIPPAKMPGRHTGTARHLTDPTNKVYFATMEEGLYEVDVRSLQVIGKIKDGNSYKPEQTQQEHPAQIASQLPGYHGKGFYAGQGRLVYANNGEHGPKALEDPTIPSGALAEWRGIGDWQLVRRNQFTEVTGPGGIYGNSNSDTDPIWSIGWDARSLILMVLDHGKWRAYRLPKASHSYDGAHGWNTEWPRIRDIGERDLLMTMHGMFWKFPKTFSLANSAGIAPRSTYLKVIGDFAKWNDRIVFGCDDTAKSEFLNKRKAKGNLAGPGQSQSNTWFVPPDDVDDFGPALGRGAVWLNDDVSGNAVSDPFLFSGFERRGLHLAHQGGQPVTFTLEVDERGSDTWRELKRVIVPAHGYSFVDFPSRERGAWIRLRADRDTTGVTAFFHFSNRDRRSSKPSRVFEDVGSTNSARGVLFARGANLRTLRFADEKLGCYDMGADLKLAGTNDTAGLTWTLKSVAIPQNVFSIDDASVLFVDDNGKRWRLPKGDVLFTPRGDERIDREVCTERDLFNCAGIFYELPAENAGGFARIRPITTHNRRIADYCSYRGMLVMSGVAHDAKAGEHIVRSDDGKVALWLGVVDDLWQFGKARGVGGPWRDSTVKANTPSDPYLMTGFDKKSVTLSHQSQRAVNIAIEVDFTGNGEWHPFHTFTVPPGKTIRHKFNDAFAAYWVRTVADRDTTATAQFVYE
jgi:hypothetical protein